MSSAPTGTADALVLGDRVGDPAGERHAAALDADEGQTGGARLLLDDLVGDADRRPADLVRGHDLAAAHRSFPASRGLMRPHGAGSKGPRKDTPAPAPADRRASATRSRRMRQHEPNTDSLGGLPSHMLTLGYKASAEQFGPRDLLAFAIHAERAGFESVFVSDHFQPWRNTDGHAPHCARLAGRARDADAEGDDRDERPHAVVPLPPGGRRPGVLDARLAGRRRAPDRPRPRHRRVAQRGPARHRVARAEGALRPAARRRPSSSTSSSPRSS